MIKIKLGSAALENINQAINIVLRSFPFAAIFVVTSLLSLTTYYAVLVSSTPWDIFVESNSDLYINLQIISSIISSILLGLVVAMMVYVLENRRQDSNLTFVQAAGSLLFSVAATGCTVCGAVLLPTLGIAASLTALPFAGLEIKVLSLLLLAYSVSEYSKLVVGKCDIKLSEAFPMSTNAKGEKVYEINKYSLNYLKPIVLTVGVFFVFTLIPKLPAEWRVDFSRSGQVLASGSTNQRMGSDSGLSGTDFTEQINPSSGIKLGVTYGNIGPSLVESGAISLEDFTKVYENAGSPLTNEQLAILTGESNEEIVINRENSYFLLNFFWALGLANENKLLTEGEIAQYGQEQIESFASTGGWSLASKPFNDYYSKAGIINLTEAQQKLVEEVSSNIYRPCCGNPTSFPDCNHGMALLGVIQLMAASGASEQEIYETAKYINAYWFPSVYNDLAMYFQETSAQSFAEVDAKTILGKEFSSSGGYQSKKSWMEQNGILPEPPKTSGGGCGV